MCEHTDKIINIVINITGFRDRSRKKTWPQGGSELQRAVLGAALMGYMRPEVLHRPSRDNRMEPTPTREEGKGTPEERGIREDIFMSGQWHSVSKWVNSSQRVSRGSRDVGSSIVLGFVCLSYLWLADVGCSFTGYTKQPVSKWLKMCFLELCLNQLDM